MQEKTTTAEVIESIDDFLPMPGAETIVTAESGKNTEGSKPANIFSKEQDVDLSFLDKEEEEDDVDNKTKAPGSTSSSSTKKEDNIDIDNIINDLDENGENNQSAVKSEKGMLSVMKALIDDETFFAFDDEKPLEEYSKKDWQDLIKANLEEKEKALREQTPKEFFDALPEELQYAAIHVAKGNTNLKDVFAALARREEVKELDPSNDDHQELIARQYLQATGFGSGDNELIEDQLREWVENGTIRKKAEQFKPKLDKMQEKILEADLKRQEVNQQKQVQQKEAYMRNIYEALKPAELNGLKLSNKRQNILWNELTTVKYQSMKGNPTNLLGKLLEDYQFGEKPRYDLIAETLWLLSDPDDYKASIRSNVESEIVGETAKKLKTEEGRKLRSTSSFNDEEDDSSRKTSKKTLSRPQGNIFKR